METCLVELPKLYENMSEATIGTWRVAVGQTVAQGDVLVELVTDKTVVDFESPSAGTVLAIYAEEKSTVPQGYVLCALGDAGAAAPDVSSQNAALVSAHIAEATGGIDMSAFLQTTATPAAAPSPAFRSAPAAKAFAREKGVDLADVAAFCKRDMIHRKDVEDYLAVKQPASLAVQNDIAERPVSMPSAVASTGPRVALVTGGAGGIGGAIARRLAAQGTIVAIHYHNNAAGAEQTAAEIRASGGQCECFQADLAGDSTAAQTLADAVLARFGRIDILVNNAGCLSDSIIAFMDDAAWSRVLELCLMVPFKLIRAISGDMAHRRWGRIVNISSDAGRMGSANRSNYASAKEGLCGLTRSAALELAGLGIRVNAVSPGFVDSPMTANIPDVRKTALLKTIPARRFGTPEDIAAMVAFLCSDDADYITGQVISVNGGLTMG